MPTSTMNCYNFRIQGSTEIMKWTQLMKPILNTLDGFWYSFIALWKVLTRTSHSAGCSLLLINESPQNLYFWHSPPESIPRSHIKALKLDDAHTENVVLSDPMVCWEGELKYALCTTHTATVGASSPATQNLAGILLAFLSSLLSYLSLRTLFWRPKRP